MMRLYNALVRFDSPATCEHFLVADQSIIKRNVNLCTTRRYSHSMSKVYEKCDLELDEVIQRCLDQLKYFFTSQLGQQWLGTFPVYPPFLAKSFVPLPANHQLISTIKHNISL